MDTIDSKIRSFLLSKPIIAIVGGFGSGKTEVSVNLAKLLKSTEKSAVTIIDLDLVNPYFRSREAITELEALEIRVIAPQGGQAYADLPILLPEIKGAIEQRQGRVLLDVGGDAQGSKALGSLADVFQPGRYEMLMVLNSRRPFTSDVEGCIKTMTRIETTSKLKFTGLISNSHMIDESGSSIIMEGYHLAQEVSHKTGLPLVFVGVRRELLSGIDPTQLKAPVLPLIRSMLKPWESKSNLANNQSENRRK